MRLRAMGRTRMLAALVAGALVAGFCGCLATNTAGGGLQMAMAAHYVDYFDPRGRVDPKAGYIYGALVLKAQSGGPRFSLGLENTRTGELRRILFNERLKAVVVEIPPGEYRFTHTLLAGRSRMVEGDFALVPFEEPLFSEPFQVRARSLLYVGDYIAETQLTGSSGLGMEYKGRLAAVGHNFDETTAVMRTKWVNLASLEAASAWSDEAVAAWRKSLAGATPAP